MANPLHNRIGLRDNVRIEICSLQDRVDCRVDFMETMVRCNLLSLFGTLMMLLDVPGRQAGDLPSRMVRG